VTQVGEGVKFPKANELMIPHFSQILFIMQVALICFLASILLKAKLQCVLLQIVDVRFSNVPRMLNQLKVLQVMSFVIMLSRLLLNCFLRYILRLHYRRETLEMRGTYDNLIIVL
jgi:hypothetical protein